MTKKENSLHQELGTKKYREKVEAANKFYDKYKAGKTDPKTGEYYNPISFSNPNARKFKLGLSIGEVQCINEQCDYVFSIRRTTRAVICPVCKTLNSFSKEEIEELLKDE